MIDTQKIETARTVLDDLRRCDWISEDLKQHFSVMDDVLGEYLETDEADLDSLDSAIDSLKNSLADLQREQNNVESAVNDMEYAISELDTNVDYIASEFENLRS